jgi:homoserine O-acetyltransferase
MTHFFPLPSPLVLQSGARLNDAQLAFEIYGELNQNRDNAILVFHALTGSQHAAGFLEALPARAGANAQAHWTEDCQTGWWDDFIGPGKSLDTNRFFVICANYLGGCYGSTGPSSLDPATGKEYGSHFPRVTIADIADSQMRLIDELQIEKLHAVIGASLGGMLALSVATRYPERTRIVIPIATTWQVTPLQRLLNFEQIFAVESDPNFHGGDYYDGSTPDRGLAAARMISHKTFVSLEALAERARGEIVRRADDLSWYRLTHPLESYLLHQGRKFVKRFDANTYLQILHAWQSFDLLRESIAEDAAALFSRCRAQEYLVFSIDSDVCFYPAEQADLVSHLKAADVNAMRITVHSDKGHDSFLLEPELFEPFLRAKLND